MKPQLVVHGLQKDAGFGVAFVPMEVEGDRTACGAADRGVYGLRHQSVCQIMVMNRCQRLCAHHAARSMHAVVVSQQCRALWLVQSGPTVHCVAECLCRCRRIVGENIWNIPVHPSSTILKILGEIPVVQGEIRFDARFQEGIYDETVVVYSFLVDAPIRGGNDAWNA